MYVYNEMFKLKMNEEFAECLSVSWLLLQIFSNVCCLDIAVQHLNTFQLWLLIFKDVVDM